MKLQEFRSSLAGEAPPGELSAPLLALWWQAKGDWAKAHEAAQSDEGRQAALVHAHLHRVEGDLSNAGYWYRRAERPAATGTLDAEWEAIATELL